MALLDTIDPLAERLERKPLFVLMALLIAQNVYLLLELRKSFMDRIDDQKKDKTELVGAQNETIKAQGHTINVLLSERTGSGYRSDTAR